jgi:hypothetical protein
MAATSAPAPSTTSATSSPAPTKEKTSAGDGGLAATGAAIILAETAHEISQASAAESGAPDNGETAAVAQPGPCADADQSSGTTTNSNSASADPITNADLIPSLGDVSQAGGIIQPLQALAPTDGLDPTCLLSSLGAGDDAGTSTGHNSVTDLGTEGPIVAPLAAVANDAVLDVHAALEATSDALADPAPALLHALTNFGESVGMGHIGETAADGTTNLVTALLDVPDATVNGGGPLEALCVVVDEVPDAVAAVGMFAQDVLNGADLGGATGNGIVGDLVGSVTNDPFIVGDLLGTGPDGYGLLTLDVDPNTASGAIVDASLLSSTHGTSDPGGAHLIDVGALSPESFDLGSLNILATPANEQSQGVDVHAIDNSNGGPRLLDADLLTDDSFVLPATGTPIDAADLSSLGPVGGLLSGDAGEPALPDATDVLGSDGGLLDCGCLPALADQVTSVLHQQELGIL